MFIRFCLCRVYAGPRLDVDNSLAFKLLWHSNVPSNIQAFALEAIVAEILNKSQACKIRGIGMFASLVFPFCLGPEESHSHIFLLCPVAVIVWWLLLDRLGIGCLSQCDSILDHLLAFCAFLKEITKKR